MDLKINGLYQKFVYIFLVYFHNFFAYYFYWCYFALLLFRQIFMFLEINYFFKIARVFILFKHIFTHNLWFLFCTFLHASTAFEQLQGLMDRLDWDREAIKEEIFQKYWSSHTWETTLDWLHLGRQNRKPHQYLDGKFYF